MPRTRVFKKKVEKEKPDDQQPRRSSLNPGVDEGAASQTGLLDKELVPQPFHNFIKIMVPQIKKFENKSKAQATKIAWHRWEVMNECFKRPFQRMENVESVDEKCKAPDFLKVFRKKN